MMSDNFRIVINMKTARAIGIYPGFDVMSEAELINPTRIEVERKINLAFAVEEAVKLNLDIAAKQRSVNANENNIDKARSVLLPQIEELLPQHPDVFILVCHYFTSSLSSRIFSAYCPRFRAFLIM